MKNIKFRAWEINKSLAGKMSKPFTLTDIHNNGLGTFGDSYEFMQFTGLKDINGKEIYEGDIVNAVQNYHGKPSSIMFNAKIIYNDNVGSFMISYKNINDVFVNDEIWLRYFLEVIGNIHENPELL